MTEPLNGLRAPADSGLSFNPSTDERIIRALREDHQTHSHHANLCPLCLIVAARLGEPMPDGRYVAPCERALVYARALHVLGAFDDSDVRDVYEAVRRSRTCTPDGDFGGYMFAANRLRGLLALELSSADKFDDEAYDAIRNAIVHAQASEYLEMLANTQEEYNFSADTRGRSASAGPDGFPHAEGASVADLEVRNQHAGYPSAEDLDLAVEEQLVAALTAGEVPAAAPSIAAELTEGAPLRCPECRRHRHATPRHEPNCPKAHLNCPGCIDTREPHLACCPLSVFVRQPEDSCCIGVDMPGIGRMHNHDCPRQKVVRASRTTGFTDRTDAYESRQDGAAC